MKKGRRKDAASPLSTLKPHNEGEAKIVIFYLLVKLKPITHSGGDTDPGVYLPGRGRKDGRADCGPD